MNIDFLDKVRETVEEYSMLREGDRVFVGVSGGADSTALLKALYILRDEYGISVSAVHINHGIRGQEADRDEEFVKFLCEDLGIPFLCLHADVPALAKQQKLGLEEAGRQVRYDFFEKCAKGGKIATAHTLSDNAETVLMRLCRGAGLKGLCGIPPKRGNIIRPLINCSREQVEEFCREQKLCFVTDSTNLNTEYSRNFIRKEIVPLFKNINPEFEPAVSRMADLARFDEEFLERCTNDALQNLVCENRLDALKTASLDKGLRLRVLKKFLEPCSPEFRHICQTDKILKTGGSVNLSGDKKAVCDGTTLEIVPVKPALQPGFYQTVDISSGKAELSAFGKKIVLSVIKKSEKSETNGCRKINNLLSYSLLDRDKIGKTVVVRTRLEGDKISLLRRKCTKSLKKLWIEKKIDCGLRGRMLIVESDGRLAFSEPDGVDAAFEVTKETKEILSVQIFAEG